jgi:hypothetical protein
MLKWLFARRARLDAILGPTAIRLTGTLACHSAVSSPCSSLSGAVLEWRVFVRRWPLISRHHPELVDAEEHFPLDGPPLLERLLVGEITLETREGTIPIAADGLSVELNAPFVGKEVRGDVALLPELGELPAPASLEGDLFYAERMLRVGERVRLEGVVEPCAAAAHPYRRATNARFALRPDLAPVRLIQVNRAG